MHKALVRAMVLAAVIVAVSTMSAWAQVVPGGLGGRGGGTEAVGQGGQGGLFGGTRGTSTGGENGQGGYNPPAPSAPEGPAPTGNGAVYNNPCGPDAVQAVDDEGYLLYDDYGDPICVYPDGTDAGTATEEAPVDYYYYDE